MNVTYAQVSAPASEPISLADAKDYLRITSSDDDSVVSACIAAARSYVEKITATALINQQWKATFSAFPDVGYIDLEKPIPLVSVQSFNYIDADGNSTAFTDYTADTSGLYGRLYLNYNKSWPVARDVFNAVQITYTVGQGATSADVSPTIKRAIFYLIGHFYKNREAEVTGTVSTSMKNGVEMLLAAEGRMFV